MRRLFARRPTPAMGVAFVALLAALSGTAVALPGKNTVDSGDVKNNSIRSGDIRNGHVRGGDVRNNSLTGADVVDNSLSGADIDEGSLGQVPSANSASSANTATTAANAEALGGRAADSFKPSAAGLTTAFMVDGSNLENGAGPLPTFDSNVSGADTFTFPYAVNDGTHNVIVSGGGGGHTGGTGPCVHLVDPVDADTITVESVTIASPPAACSEEYTVVVF